MVNSRSKDLAFATKTVFMVVAIFATSIDPGIDGGIKDHQKIDQRLR
ncbi:MAG: hypothetical protein PXY39_08880 [archaeon]|nr:hypothetical protein [archaeon]